MTTVTCTTIENAHLSVTVDEWGRLVSLVNRATRTELIDCPAAAEAWRMVVPTGRSTVAFVRGAEQRPRIEVTEGAEGPAIVLEYASLRVGDEELAVRARFELALPAGTRELAARVEIDNRSGRAIDEVEFPIVGGLGGFRARGGTRLAHLAAGNEHGAFYPDVLANGLPETGLESNHYVRALETAMFPCVPPALYPHPIRHHGIWADLWSAREGLYLGFTGDPAALFAVRLEKSPKEHIVTHRRVAHYPAGTARWLRLAGLHMPKISPGGQWRSGPVTLLPHRGDWHAGADRYAADRRAGVAACEPPAWFRDFVGWTEILGWTYLGEIYHDYRRCAEEVIRDARVTGLDFVFFYGHATHGAEAADYDNGPAPELGGEGAFRDMVDALHAQGIRIMLLDHLHRFVNRSVPEFDRYHLEEHAIRFKDGRMAAEQLWWKETGLSCLYLDGPTPEWVEMCPYCEGWQEHYLRHLTRMVELGVDGLELDVFLGRHCYHPGHGHAPGASPLDGKLAFMRRARAHVKGLNPDFVFVGEGETPETAAVLDGWYPYRYPDENGRIYRYIFPELRRQAVLAGNYEYDQVNKALQLGLGVETEIDGLRRTAAEACPELARYLGEVNRLKRRCPEIFLHGRFRDTLGARVSGRVSYAVIEGASGGRALVLRNPTAAPQRVRARFAGRAAGTATLWQPFEDDIPVALPARLTLAPYRAAVLLQR